MAFTQANVDYAKEYGQALANAYPYLSCFPEIWAGENARLYKPGIGKTMYIPTLTTSGARAADRDQVTGAFSRNWNNSFAPVTLEMDREWDTLVDPMDMEETNAVATIANITRAFNEQQKIPEMDAYLASKLYSFVTPDTSTINASTMLNKWDGWLEQLANAHASLDRVVCYMRPGLYSILKQCNGMTRYFQLNEKEGGEGGALNRCIASLDGVTIRVVPDNIMKSAFDFEEGWAPASGAKQINLIMLSVDSVAAPVKYETSIISEPTAQSKGKYLYYERYYYGAFRLEQRGGIIVNAAA